MFREAILTVANSDVQKKMVGFSAERPVVANIGRTLCELVLAPRSRSIVTEDCQVSDYRLPTGTGMLELANIGKVFLFDEVIQVTDAIQAKQNCLINEWAAECQSGNILTPEGLESQLMTLFRLSGRGDQQFTNVTKKDVSLYDFKSIYAGKNTVAQCWRGDSSTLNELSAYFLRVQFVALVEYGLKMPIVKEDRRYEWFFGLGAANSAETSKDTVSRSEAKGQKDEEVKEDVKVS